MTAPNNIFNDPDQLVRIWENERETRNLNVKLMWENMKYFGALISALIAASVALVGFTLDKHVPVLFPILIIILQFFIIFLAEYAKRDLRERRKRFFLIVTHLLKLEVLLGLYSKENSEKLKEKLRETNLKDDDFLFTQYERNLHIIEGNGKHDTEQFINNKMNGKKEYSENNESESDKHNSYSIMSNVYLIMQITMGALIVAEIFILGYASYFINQIY